MHVNARKVDRGIKSVSAESPEIFLLTPKKVSVRSIDGDKDILLFSIPKQSLYIYKTKKSQEKVLFSLHFYRFPSCHLLLKTLS